MKTSQGKIDIKKMIYIVLGSIGLVLGAIGAAMPLMPAFPFLLMAAVCFGKSSEKLDKWFKGTKLYKNNLESYVQGQGMTRSAKIRVMLLITFLFAFGFYMMRAVMVGRIVLLIVWLFHILYFTFRVKTKACQNSIH